MKISFLGTSSMMPTKTRNLTSILINHKNEAILIDCGEGTQQQLMKLNISPSKITKILITHWHADHVLGLPSLLQTISHLNPNKEIQIFGPVGSKKFFQTINKTFIHKEKMKIKLTEIKSSKFLKTDSLTFESTKLIHSTNCLGYSIEEKDKIKMNLNYLKKFGLTKHPLLGKLQRGLSINYKGKKITPEKATKKIKGKKVTIILDTAYTDKAVQLSKNSDLLICESSFLSDLKDKAKEYNHLTAQESAKIAKLSKSKKLILTHFSQRYKNVLDFQKEAKRTFKNTLVAKELLTIYV